MAVLLWKPRLWPRLKATWQDLGQFTKEGIVVLQGVKQIVAKDLTLRLLARSLRLASKSGAIARAMEMETEDVRRIQFAALMRHAGGIPIPSDARETDIVAVADAIDAMTRTQGYSKQPPLQTALELKFKLGPQFDSTVLQAAMTLVLVNESLITLPVLQWPDAMQKQNPALMEQLSQLRSVAITRLPARSLWRRRYDMQRRSLPEVAERLRTWMGPYDVDHPQTVLEPLQEVVRLLMPILSPENGAAVKEDPQTLDLLRDLFEFYEGYAELLRHHPPPHVSDRFQHYLNGFQGAQRSRVYKKDFFEILRYEFAPTETETWISVGLRRLGPVPFLSVILACMGLIANPLIASILGAASAYVFDLMQHSDRLEVVRHDPMTGLPTWHFLDIYHGKEDELHPHGRLMRPFRMALQGRENLSLVSMDIDNFGALNSTYGSAGADRILKAVLRMLVTKKADDDLIVKRGGEEVVSVDPHTGHDQAIARANRSQQFVSDFPISMGDGRVVHVSLSFGVAQVPSNPAALDNLQKARQEWFAAADKAMKAAKDQGKNQVQAAPKPEKTATTRPGRWERLENLLTAIGVLHPLYGWRYIFDPSMFNTRWDYSLPYGVGVLGLVVTLAASLWWPMSRYADVCLAFAMVIVMITTRNNYQIDREEHDAKTGALSRGSLGTLNPNGHLPQLFQRVARKDLQLVGLVVDIDHFKEINDDERYGYPVGDRVLKTVAETLQRKFGDEKVYRLIGKTFLVLLENVSEAKAEELAAEIEEAIRGLKIGVREKNRRENSRKGQDRRQSNRPDAIKLPDLPFSLSATVIVSPVHVGGSKRLNILSDVNQWLLMGEEAVDTLKGRAELPIVAQVPQGRPGRIQVPIEPTDRPHVAVLKHVRVQFPFSVTLRGQDEEEHNWDAVNLEHLVASLSWSSPLVRSVLIDKDLSGFTRDFLILVNGKDVTENLNRQPLQNGDLVQFVWKNQTPPLGVFREVPAHRVFSFRKSA